MQREEIEVADVKEVIIRNRYQGVTEEVGISVENPEKCFSPRGEMED